MGDLYIFGNVRDHNNWWFVDSYQLSDAAAIYVAQIKNVYNVMLFLL